MSLWFFIRGRQENEEIRCFSIPGLGLEIFSMWSFLDLKCSFEVSFSSEVPAFSFLLVLFSGLSGELLPWLDLLRFFLLRPGAGEEEGLEAGSRGFSSTRGRSGIRTVSQNLESGFFCWRMRSFLPHLILVLTGTDECLRLWATSPILLNLLEKEGGM